MAGKFTDLPVYKEGKKIAYTITEDPVAGYTSNIDGFTVNQPSYATNNTSYHTTNAYTRQRLRQQHLLPPHQAHRQRLHLQLHRRHHQQRRQAPGKPETPTTPKKGRKNSSINW